MTGVLRALTILGLVTLGACSGEEGGSDYSRTTVHDSAGVQIVRSVSPELPGRGTQAALIIDLGSASDDVDLHGVVGATRLPDGRIVIANSGMHEILVVDTAGPLIDRFGREGNGPGEYRSLAWMDHWGADTLIAYDERLRRLSILTVGGEFVRSVRPQPAAEAFFPQFVGSFSDGTLLALIGEPFSYEQQAMEVRYRDSLTVLRYGRDGRLLDTLGRFPNQEAFYLRSPTGELAWSELPFGRSTAFAVGAEELHVVTGDAYEIRSYDPAGGLVRVTRLDRPRPEVTAADRDAFRRQRQERLATMDDPGRRRVHETLLDRIPFPERRAGYVSLAVSTTSELWARRDSITWDVFDDDGTLVAVTHLPAKIDVYEIGVDYMLAGRRDDLDIEHVLLYSLAVRAPD